MGSYGYSPIDLKRKDLASWSRPSLPRAFPIMQQHIALSASQPDLVKYSFPISRVLFKSSSSFVSEYITKSDIPVSGDQRFPSFSHHPTPTPIIPCFWPSWLSASQSACFCPLLSEAKQWGTPQNI